MTHMSPKSYDPGQSHRFYNVQEPITEDKIEDALEDAKIQLVVMKKKGTFQTNLDDQPIQCSEIEAISGFSYAYLVSESYKKQKGFIIARVKTRSNQDHNKNFYHYFYAAYLIQLLVKPNINFLE